MKLKKEQIDKIISTLRDISSSLKEDEFYEFKGDIFKFDFNKPKEIASSYFVHIARNLEESKLIIEYIRNLPLSDNWSREDTYKYYLHVKDNRYVNGWPSIPYNYNNLPIYNIKELI